LGKKKKKSAGYGRMNQNTDLKKKEKCAERGNGERKKEGSFSRETEGGFL